jgi:hypothetical protein
MDTGLGRGNRLELIVDRRGGAGKIIDFIDLDVEREGDIVANQFEMWISQQVSDVVTPTAESR